MGRLIEIHNKLPNVHLVMHGSSSVPKELQDIINRYGGKLKPTWACGRENPARIKTACARSTWIPTTAWHQPAPFARSSGKRPRNSIRATTSSRARGHEESGGRAHDAFGQAATPATTPHPLAEMARRYAREAVAV